MAYIQERTGQDGRKKTYRVQVRIQGHPLQTASFTRLTDAKRWAQQTEAAIREGRLSPSSKPQGLTIADLIDRYLRDVLPTKPKALKDQTTQLRWWRGQIGHLPLEELSAPILAQQRDILAGQPTARGVRRSPATVNRYLAALSHAFSIAQREWEWLKDNPLRNVKKPREPRGRVRFLSDDERERLLAACRACSNPSVIVIVSLALFTGMRYTEIMTLTWKDVDLERKRIILEQTKNGERRAVPLVDAAVEMLTQHQATNPIPSMLVFPSWKNPARPLTLGKTWARAVKRAELQDFHFHDIRHCTASYLAMSGATPSEIAEVLGHKTLAMVKRYAHLTDTHTANVLQRMADKYSIAPCRTPEEG